MSTLKKCQLILGDSSHSLRTIESDSLDAMVTDPPAGIGLLDLAWDKDKGGRDEWIAWLRDLMREAFRTLKPGAHGFVWALPRTSHWTATALEDAGFEVRDVIVHAFGSGFPKSMAMDQAIDKARVKDTAELLRATTWIGTRARELGLSNADLDRLACVRGCGSHWTARAISQQPTIPPAERWAKLEPVLGPAPDWLHPMIKPAYARSPEWTKRRVVGFHSAGGGGIGEKRFISSNHGAVTETENPIAKMWLGWGTSLKPASEHWILVRKPLGAHNTAANVLKFGTGAINIEGTRIETEDKIHSSPVPDFTRGRYLEGNPQRLPGVVYRQHPKGRFPSNLVLTSSPGHDCPALHLDEQSKRGDEAKGASRFFKVFEPEVPFLYCAKPSRSEKGATNEHPTVKPTALMRYLCRMITPAGGVVLDPFLGSGTTGVAALKEGFRFIGVEKEPAYYAIAKDRIAQIVKQLESESDASSVAA